MSPPRRSNVPVRVLRAAARRRVEEIRLRPAAEEMGLSFSGLRTFLQGTDPYSATVQKLREWYERTGQGRAPAVEQVTEMVESLAIHFPVQKREESSEDLMDRIASWCEAWCDKTQTPIPNWLADLKRHG